MPTDQSDLLEQLHARRAALEQLAEAAQVVGNRQSLELNQLLIRQCDYLIERAHSEARRNEKACLFDLSK